MQNQHDRGRRDGDFVLSTPSEVENELPFQLIGVGCDFYQYAIKRPFGFPVYQWIQTASGAGALKSGGRELHVGTNEGMLLYPNEAHEYYPLEDTWYVHWITFSGHHVAPMLNYAGLTETGVYRVTEITVIESQIRKALAILKSDYPLRGVDGSGVIYQLLLDFLKFYQPHGTESRNNLVLKLKPALDLIEREMAGPISLEDLAGSIGVRPQYFCDIFRNLTSHRPMEYVNQRRIDRAKHLLVSEPSTKVHDIASRVGFESDSYFSTVFKRFEGITPRQYREANARAE